jgi:acyl-CoA synthetase (AMP-forming)/AMP-acid ligase II
MQPSSTRCETALQDITHIAQIPAYWARHTPQATAVFENDQPTCYAELARYIDNAGALLHEHGVQAGDRVLIVSENCVAQIALIFGAAALNAWPLAINARMAPREIDDIAELVSPRVCCYTSSVSPEADGHAARRGASVVAPGVLPGTVKISRHSDARAPEPADLAGRVGVLIATSGSTGSPKAVLVPHRGLLHFCRVSVQARALQPDDVVYAVLPISHIFGIGTQLLVTLYGGASLYLEPRFTPEALLAAMQRRGISMLFGVPTLYARLLAHLRESGHPLPPHRVRYAYVGAAALEMSLKHEFERLFGCRLHHGYGMTEYAGSMFITRVDRPRDDASAGYATEGCEVRLVDKEGRDVPPGEVGEIWIRGPGLMLGYYRAPDLTEQAMKHAGYFNTGDLGRLTHDGALFMVGRSKDMIIRSGFNVYPAEVEAALNTHPAIHLSAVLGRRQADGNEEVVAFVELEPGARFDRIALREWLRERLAPYKLPADVKVLAAVPLLSNGKLAKQVLREQLEAQ